MPHLYLLEGSYIDYLAIRQPITTQGRDAHFSSEEGSVPGPDRGANWGWPVGHVEEINYGLGIH